MKKIMEMEFYSTAHSCLFIGGVADGKEFIIPDRVIQYMFPISREVHGSDYEYETSFTQIAEYRRVIGENTFIFYAMR